MIELKLGLMFFVFNWIGRGDDMVNTKDERKAFEATQNPIVFERIVYIEKANLYTMKDDFRDDLFTVNKCNELNFGWSSWQAAKVHEAKKLKGCVVVPVEPTQTMIDAMEQFNDRHDYADMTSAYKAMLEAARGGK